MLGCASLHHIAGGALADGVYGGHAKVIVGVRAEAAYAVARCGDTIDLFIGVIGSFGTVLEGREKKGILLYLSVCLSV